VESDFDWNTPTESPMTKHHRPWPRTQVIAAIVLGIGGPCAAYELRGLCWETLLWSIVIFAIALMLVRPPFSVWLAAVLMVGVFGSVGLMGWSGLRFHSLNVFSSYSPRLTICGRDYQPEGPTTTKVSAPFKHLTQVMGVTPSGSAIVGAGCQTTALYIESPGPMYRPYALLGGP
jgi:hypothetical protein